MPTDATAVPVAVPLFCSVEYGCNRWSCSRDYLYELLTAGKIHAVIDGRRTKIQTASGDTYFLNLPSFKDGPRRAYGRNLKPKPAASSTEAA